jgi:hypothetical protein
MAGERFDAYKDLGGQQAELSDASKRAMTLIGVGSREMQAQTRAQIEAEENARQDAVNKAGAAGYRNAVREQDRARGIDVDSVEYLAKERLAEARRGRRA